MENKMNKILMETKGSELQKLIERMDMDMGTVKNLMKSGIENNDLNDINGSLYHLRLGIENLSYYVIHNDEFKEQIEEYHKRLDFKPLVEDNITEYENLHKVDFDKLNIQLKSTDDEVFLHKLEETHLENIIKEQKQFLKFMKNYRKDTLEKNGKPNWVK